MEAIVTDRGSIILTSESGAEAFTLKHYLLGVELIESGSFVTTDGETISITIAAIAVARSLDDDES